MKHRETEAKVQELLNATGGMHDQLSSCCIDSKTRDDILDGKLTEYRKQHVARHAAAFRESKIEWQLNEDKDELQELLQKEAAVKGLAEHMACERVTKPEWPPFMSLTQLQNDPQLFVSVQSLMTHAMREQALAIG